MLRQFIIILISFSLGLSGFAQKIKFSGQVFDSDSKDYIPFSAVALSQNERQSFATAANIDGKFEFDSVPPGKYRLMVRVVGYEPYSDSLFVCAKDTSLVRDFFLNTKVYQHEELFFLPYFIKPIKKKKKTIP